MIYIEAPNTFWEVAKSLSHDDQPSLFLAGGITDCPDWQKEVKEALSNEEIVIFNPRRANFPIHDPSAARKQILWEFKHLRLANAILFWFPKETMCPIVLYELGAWSMTPKEIFIGVHPEYKRKQDVEIQTSLARPEVKIAYSLKDLIKQVKGQ